MNKKIVLFFMILLIAPLVNATVADWYGTVTIGTNTSTNGAAVEAFIGTTVKAGTNVGEFSSGYYLLNVDGNTGDYVTFKVYGVNATQGDQAWTLEGRTLNLNMTPVANGTVCSYNASCSSGMCVDGYCCNSWCAGECDRCDVSGRLGTCTDVNGYCSNTASSCYCSGGSCVACASGYTCSSYTCEAPSGGGTGGGGGGGGVTSETEIISSMPAGSTTTATFSESSALNIQEIALTVANPVTDVQIKVEKSAKPVESNVAIGGDGAVYDYLKITKSNIQDSDISGVKIKFKVKKSWVNENAIDPATITLKKLIGSDWIAQPTVKLSGDTEYYYFETSATGFSYFVITGEKKSDFWTIVDLINTYYKGGAVTFWELIAKIDAFYR